MPVPLPSNLKYQTKVEGAACKCYRQTIQPNGPTTYALGDVPSFNIPTRRNLVMVPNESYLQFDLVINNTSGANSTYRLDSCGAHGLFQKVKETHGSNVLYELDNYGLFSKMLYDNQSSLNGTYGKLNILTGSRNDFVGTYTTPAAFAASTSYTLPVKQVNSGEIFVSAADTTISTVATGASTASRTYCLNLISILGALSPRNYLPLFAMTSAPLRLDLYIVDSIAKFCACTNATGTITISNMVFNAQFIELSDEAMNTLYEYLPENRIEFPITSYKNYMNSNASVNNGVQVSIPIPAKFASLKGLITCQRISGQLANATYFPYSCLTCSLASYRFNIGPITVPSTAPSKFPEMYAELCKVFGSISDINYNPNIEFSSYSQSTNTALTDTNFNAASSGSFYIGIDLENFPDAPKDSIFAGWNSTTDDIYLNITYGTSGALSVRYDTYAVFDAVIVCENSTAYVRV